MIFFSEFVLVDVVEDLFNHDEKLELIFNLLGSFKEKGTSMEEFSGKFSMYL